MSDKYPGGFVTANAPAGFSVALNGSSDYLTTANSLGINNFGTGDFTIESWINFNVVGNGQIVSAGDGSVSNAYFWQYYSSQLSFGAQSIGSIAATNWSPVANTWYHVAVTRSGTSVRQFVNGVQLGSTVTSSQNFIDGPTWIGNAGAGYFNGYISNVRVIKGTALYTTTFTPPTQLFPVTNTTLLTCQSPTLVDNSTTAATITAVSGAKVSNFTPFAAYQGFNPALGAAAGGVWTIDEAAYYQQNRLWPIYDPYFNQTTLMLHGNGTNAAQNNTFLDSSTNNFTITRNGNTTQGSFSPFSQTGWSNFFDGSSYLTVNNAATQLALGTGDWQIEMWCYPTSLPGSGDNLLYDGRPGNGAYPMFAVRGVSAASPQKVIYYTNTALQITSDSTVPIGAWTHIMLSRVSSVTRMFINGVVQSQTYADTTNYLNDSTHPQIGRNAPSNAEFWNGYITNVRVLKGSGTSTSFTPSTAPLTATTNTVLLTCQDNRFVDDSANNFAITTGGTPSVQAFSPFVPAYITPTTYSNWFDGTGDYLQTPSNSAFAFGTGDFTIEAFFFPTATTANLRLFEFSDNNDNIGANSTSTGTITYFNGSTNTVSAGTPFAANQWNHVAVVRSSGTVTVYVNGTSALTQASTPNTTSARSVGIAGISNTWFPGCISNVRILKGTALYTTAFTPPTAPLTNITNTSLLTCQSSTFIDNSTNNFAITATGNVQPVTSPTPFPANVDTTTLNSAYSTSLIGGSGYFDGSGDNLSLANNAALFPGTGDFTLEFWIYPTVVSGNQMIWGNNANGLDIYRGSASGKLLVDQANVGTILTSTANVIANTWTYYAVTRSGTTARLFVNGVLDATATNSANLTNANSPTIGASPGGTNPYTGYISGLRFVKGTALYSTSFAPPLTPPTPVTNTQLLTNYTNGAIFDNTAKNVLETVGNAQISTTQSKWGGSSMYFDGSGDWLVAANGRNFINGTEPFTIECWVYITGTPNYWSICGASSGTLVLTIQNLTTININPYGSANTLSATTSLSINTWTHIAATRNSANRFDIWVNGVSAGNTTSSQSFGSPTYYAIGAADSGAAQPFNGYIDDLRITKACRYFGTFTPPTSQLQDQ
jgi:hypothetical protein